MQDCAGSPVLLVLLNILENIILSPLKNQISHCMSTVTCQIA